MTTAYPGALDAWSNPTSTTTMDDASFQHDVLHGNHNDAIEAIEGELGTNPKGAQSTVKARLDYTANFQFPGLLVWRTGDYSQNQVSAASPSTTSIAANTIVYQPWWCPRSTTVDRCAVEVTTGQTSGAAHLALYSAAANGLPDALIADFGAIVATAAAVQELTVSQAVTGGTLYWLALHNSIASTAYRAVGDGAAIGTFNTSTFTTAALGRTTASRTYASGVPATATSSSAAPAPVLFWLRSA